MLVQVKWLIHLFLCLSILFLNFSPIVVLAQDSKPPSVVKGRFAPKIPDDGLTPWQRRLQRFDRLIYKATQEGTVRVGIELDVVEPRPKSELQTFVEQQTYIDALVDNVTKVREKFLKKYPQLRNKIIDQGEVSAILSLEGDAITLGAMKYDKSIVFIQEIGVNFSAPNETTEPPPSNIPTPPPFNLTSIPSNTTLNSFTGSGKVIVVIDSGIDRTHPAFAGKIVQEACFSEYNPSVGIYSLCPGNGTKTQVIGTGAGANCPITLDQGCFHGTHVAGIALGNSVR